MDFDQLVTFLEVAKLGSFSRAGQKVFRSQSAVSAQIRQLEQEYGDRLLDRSGKDVTLTPAGRVLFTYAERLLQMRDESLLAVAASEDWFQPQSNGQIISPLLCPLASAHGTRERRHDQEFCCRRAGGFAYQREFRAGSGSGGESEIDSHPRRRTVARTRFGLQARSDFDPGDDHLYQHRPSACGSFKVKWHASNFPIPRI